MVVKEISQQLANQAESVCLMLLPAGKVVGSHYVVGSVGGEEGQSLKVNLSGSNTGLWKDFADSGKGGDLLDLWAAVKRISIGEALKEAKAYLGVEEVAPKRPAKKDYKAPAVSKTAGPVKEGSKVFAYLTTQRRLSKETLKAFKVGENHDCVLFPFYGCESHKLAMVKQLKLERKNGKKDIRPTSKDQRPCLFGWQAVPEMAREIIICEGEINAMSCFQMGHPALATPFGAGDGKKHTWFELEYENLERFEKVFLWFDDDKPGKHAVVDLSSRIGLERCWVIDGSKDANDVLRERGSMEDIYRNATETKPHYIARLNDFSDDLIEYYFGNSRPEGLTFPWPETHAKFRLRPGEVSIVAGYSGHGKTTAMLQLAAFLVKRYYNDNIEICIATMEGNILSQIETLLRFYCASDDQKLPQTPEDMAGLIDIVGQAVSLYNEPGTGKVDNVLECFRYARRRYGANLFIVDNLTSLDVGIEDYEGQRKFIQKIVNFAKDEMAHVIVVAHMRKPSSELIIPGKHDLRGSSSITDLVDNFFVFWRNVDEMPEKPQAVMKCDKNREDGRLSSVPLLFDKDKGFLYDSLFTPKKKGEAK